MVSVPLLFIVLLVWAGMALFGGDKTAPAESGGSKSGDPSYSQTDGSQGGNNSQNDSAPSEDKPGNNSSQGSGASGGESGENSGAASNGNEDSSSQPEQSGESSEGSGNSQNSQGEGNSGSGSGSSGNGFEKRFAENPLDASYKEQAKGLVSNKEMAELAETYAGYWEDTVNNAYERLMELSNQDEQVKKGQDAWLNGYRKAMQDISAQVAGIGGSMASVEEATLRMEYYRNRAKELYSKIYAYDPDFTIYFNARG